MVERERGREGRPPYSIGKTSFYLRHAQIEDIIIKSSFPHLGGGGGGRTKFPRLWVGTPCRNEEGQGTGESCSPDME